MQLKTSNGNAYTVHWAAVASTGFLLFQMDDARLLSVIAPEFEGLEWLKREDKNEGDKLFEGFSVLDSIKRIEPGAVLLSLGKGE